MRGNQRTLGGSRRVAYLVSGLVLVFSGMQHAVATDVTLQCTSEAASLTGTMGGSGRCENFGRHGITLEKGKTATYKGKCSFTLTTKYDVGSTEKTSFAIDGNCLTDLVFVDAGEKEGKACQYVYPQGVSSDTVAVLKGEKPISPHSLTVCTPEAPLEPMVSCDETTATDADASGRLTASVDPRTPNVHFECAPGPKGEDPNNTKKTRSGEVRCLNECVPRQGCEINPSTGTLPPGCEQPCEESGTWCTANAPTGQLPYCWEVENNPSCGNETPPARHLQQITKTWEILYTNPYIVKSCGSSGGSQTCIVYCFLYPGETPRVCPPHSWVF